MIVLSAEKWRYPKISATDKKISLFTWFFSSMGLSQVSLGNVGDH